MTIAKVITTTVTVEFNCERCSEPNLSTTDVSGTTATPDTTCCSRCGAVHFYCPSGGVEMRLQEE